MHDSRGLKIGTSLDGLVAFKERSDEPMNEPTRLQNGMKEPLHIPAGFSRDAQFYIVQDDPLPATILSLIPEYVLGDVSRGR
jgi:hypothetical protein